MQKFFNSLMNNEDENLNVLTVIIAIGILVLTALPFVKNYKYNDNHLNWLNHDYCKNLMISTEVNSVYMTEGGDNQVFGSLYFIYAEKIRPDLSPYDQMGNIFKRIYGDMRYVDGNTVARRKKMVDSSLFDGQEPFYVNIRDAADPYFIPYWQGQRPVYLTWQRPDPETLGDYYYKRYGIMYKVMDIEYNLVDYLELKKEISLAEAVSQFNRWLKRDVGTAYVMEKINKLQREGLVSFNGSTVRYVKMVDAPHKGDYLAHMLNRWDVAHNAKYWDTLSREIIISLAFQTGEIYKNKVHELREIRLRETRPEIIADIDKRIVDNWSNAKFYYREGVKYGGDSLSALYTIAMAMMNNGIEDLSEEAFGLVSNSIELYPNFFGAYSVAFQHLINQMYNDPTKEEGNLKTIERFFTLLKRQLGYYYSSRGNYANHQIWRNFGWIENHLTMLKDVPATRLTEMENQLNALLKDSPGSIDNTLAQQTLVLLYSRGLPFQYAPYIQRADALFEKLLNAKRNDEFFMGWAFSIAMQLNRPEMAYRIGKSYLSMAKGPVDAGVLYNMGVLAYQMKNNPESRNYLNRYLDGVKDDRKAAIEQRQQIDNARNILKSIQ